MASSINVKGILKMLDQGVSYNSIAKGINVSKHSVSKVDKRAKELNLSFSDVAESSDADVYKLFFQTILQLKQFMYNQIWSTFRRN